MRTAALLSLSLSFAASPLAAAQAPPAPAAPFTELAEDTTITSASGATFTVSKGWHVARPEGLIVIEEPQRELAAAFVELAAPTVEEAMAQAWKRWKPDFARSVRTTAKPPANEGWDEIAQTVYETGAEERRLVIALARRKGTTHYVTLVDGAIAAASRRGAQLNTAILGLKV